MTYTCKRQHPRLTVGKQYNEIMPNANPYNACVWNDEGAVEYIARNEFFTCQQPDH